MSTNPRLLIIVGFLLVLFGLIAPWLMVLRVVESTFTLNFLSFAASVAGILVGIIGAAMLYTGRKR